MVSYVLSLLLLIILFGGYYCLFFRKSKNENTETTSKVGLVLKRKCSNISTFIMDLRNCEIQKQLSLRT